LEARNGRASRKWDSAWRFATRLALQPGFTHSASIWLRDRKVATQTDLIYDPPGLVG